jgi:chromosome segregation ATPase
MKLIALVVAIVSSAIADGALFLRPNLTTWKEGQAASKAEKQAAASIEAKMAAVKKVVSLLESLTSQVLSEGESEAQTYNKFACFCQDTTEKKSAAIMKGTDEKTSLSTTIGDLESERNTCDQNIQTLLGDIKAAEDTKKQLTETRKKRPRILRKERW